MKWAGCVSGVAGTSHVFVQTDPLDRFNDWLSMRPIFAFASRHA